MEQTESPLKRRIRSFVKRGGRMTLAQRQAYDQHWPRFGLKVSDGELDSATVFGRAAPLVLEIGFGMGQSLVEMAQAEPDKNFIGVEVHEPGVGKLLSEIALRELPNLRVYAEDVIEVLNHCIGSQQLDRVQIYFPDPWHKKKHHKRRLIQQPFLQDLSEKIKPGGQLHIATDWQHYAEEILTLLNGMENYKNCSPDNAYIERPEFRPITKFEKRGQRLGHGVWDLLFEKI